MKRMFAWILRLLVGPKLKPCGRCNGTGYPWMDRRYICSKCNGTGAVPDEGGAHR